MDNALDQQLLKAMGVPEHDWERWRSARESLEEARAAEREAVRRNLEVLAEYISSRLDLPDGLSFELH